MDSNSEIKVNVILF